MPQAFYIDSDEEIISVVDRLRRTSSDEVALVFPHGASVLHSIVNLKLLNREAEKYGKSIVITTSDTVGMMLAEKVGIPVQNYPDPRERVETSFRTADPIQGDTRSDVRQESVRQVGNSRSFESLGSDRFYNAEGSHISSTPDRSARVDSGRAPVEGGHESVPVSRPAQEQRPISLEPSPEPRSAVSTTPKSDDILRVPVRDRSPKRLTALNSQTADIPGTDSESPLQVASRPLGHLSDNHPQSYRDTSSVGSRSVSNGISHQARPMFAPARRPAQIGSDFVLERSTSDRSKNFQPPISEPISEMHPLQKSFVAQPVPVQSPPDFVRDLPEERERKLSSYFSQNRADAPVSPSDQSPVPLLSKLESSKDIRPARSVGRRFGWFVILMLIAVCIGGGIWAFMYLPHADVSVSLKTTTTDIDQRFEAGTSVIQNSEQTRQLPVRTIEAEREITKSFDASGAASVSDQRAYGTVTITNAYDSAPQTLVATTRLLTADGKLFRLKDTITVPGMKDAADGKKIPGTVEAQAVADQSGPGYEIDPTKFAIPGLKGTPKEDKITASSSKKFIGGSSGGMVVATVTSADVLQAKKETETLVRSEIESVLRDALREGEQFIPDSIEVVVVSSNASPSVGVASKEFQYQVMVKARALVFPESDIRAMIVDRFAGEQKEKNLSVNPEKISLEYGQADADYDAATLRFSVHATALVEPAISIDSLKREFLGKRESDLQSLLNQHPEISNVEVQFGDIPFFNRIPYRSEQVEFRVKYDPPAASVGKS